jgi:hypothetical protein
MPHQNGFSEFGPTCCGDPEHDDDDDDEAISSTLPFWHSDHFKRLIINWNPAED